MRDVIRVSRCSIRAVVAYVDRVRQCARVRGRRQPHKVDAVEVTAFLTVLAMERGTSRSTSGQAHGSSDGDTIHRCAGALPAERAPVGDRCTALADLCADASLG